MKMRDWKMIDQENSLEAAPPAPLDLKPNSRKSAQIGPNDSTDSRYPLSFYGVPS